MIGAALLDSVSARAQERQPVHLVRSSLQRDRPVTIQVLALLAHRSAFRRRALDKRLGHDTARAALAHEPPPSTISAAAAVARSRCHRSRTLASSSLTNNGYARKHYVVCALPWPHARRGPGVATWR